MGIPAGCVHESALSSSRVTPACGEALAIAVAVVVTRVRSTVGWLVAVLVAAGLPLDLASIPFAGS